jgi:hypothetical protein
MAKPTKNATAICVGLSVLAAVGIILGVVYKEALFPMFFLLPTIVYEVYRTEGKSTKWAAWGLLMVFIVELILILFRVQFDLAAFLEVDAKYIEGYEVPLGDIKLLGPALMAVLSLVLLKNTRGRFTIWLAVIIIITSFAVVYSLDPTLFNRYLKIAIEEGFKAVGS